MGNAKQLRTRIKSVDSTMHITKAMEIVASSKLKKANYAMEQTKAYRKALLEIFGALSEGEQNSDFFKGGVKGKNCMIVIAGDRGLAGGYNNNIMKAASSYAKEHDTCVVPIGKKAGEHFNKTGIEIYNNSFSSSENVGKAQLNELAVRLTEDFKNGLIKEILVFYTVYHSILSQEAVSLKLLPVVLEPDSNKKPGFVLFEPSEGAVLNRAVPDYLKGVLHSCIAESFVSELSARRTAMNSANKNAQEMINNLSLEYNRARQSAITQEITEIVAGS